MVKVKNAALNKRARLLLYTTVMTFQKLFIFSWEVDVTYQNEGGKGLKSESAVFEFQSKRKVAEAFIIFWIKILPVFLFKGRIYQ